MKTTLVVMAAGMGSRFGGLKQMEPIVGDKVLLDFSVIDAKKAGFDKVVFIIKEEMYDAFKEAVGDRIAKTIDVDYAFQTISDLPEGRKKPWGTTHAILCAKDKINEPFAVLNADDYYGPNAFKDIHDFLVNATGTSFAMVAYELAQTTSANGTVTRGICEVEDGYLKDIAEISNITNDFKYKDGDTEHDLPHDAKVSMNLWGFTPDIFPLLEKAFAEFMATADLAKGECLIPNTVKDLLKAGEATVKVFKNKDKWYGITYREDLPEVKKAIGEYVKQGLY